MECRHCKAVISNVFVDLAESPASNAYLSDLSQPEKVFPLRVLVCEQCWLVQTEDFAAADELFEKDYAYFSSYSPSWLVHCETYVDDMVNRFELNTDSCVVEVAANDGYLLQFVKARNIECYGVEPTASTAAAAREKGIDIVEEFFGVELGKRLASAGRQADLIAAKNVLAHVPDINDFVGGFKELLKPDGVSTFEIPYLIELVREGLFDTIYHEHYSYLSLTALNTIFSANGLTVFDAEPITTHGGSLRVYAQRSDTANQPISANVSNMLTAEANAGVSTLSYYEGFQPRVDKIRDDLLKFVADTKEAGKTIAAYGAAAKGNTLLNYSGVTSADIDFVVDANPHKQGQFMPGSHIPIFEEAELKEAKPDYVLVLPWNLWDEISGQLTYVADWDGHLVRAVPALEIA